MHFYSYSLFIRNFMNDLNYFILTNEMKLYYLKSATASIEPSETDLDSNNKEGSNYQSLYLLPRFKGT